MCVCVCVNVDVNVDVDVDVDVCERAQVHKGCVAVRMKQNLLEVLVEKVQANCIHIFVIGMSFLITWVFGVIIRLVGTAISQVTTRLYFFFPKR